MNIHSMVLGVVSYTHLDVYKRQGLQFKYMQMEDLAMSELSYLQEHLRILSAFYGIVRRCV